MPVLRRIALGRSLDDEVFLLSRIKVDPARNRDLVPPSLRGGR
jgi:hypothetical protein